MPLYFKKLAVILFVFILTALVLTPRSVSAQDTASVKVAGGITIMATVVKEEDPAKSITPAQTSGQQAQGATDSDANASGSTTNKLKVVATVASAVGTYFLISNLQIIRKSWRLAKTRFNTTLVRREAKSV